MITTIVIVALIVLAVVTIIVGGIIYQKVQTKNYSTPLLFSVKTDSPNHKSNDFLLSFFLTNIPIRFPIQH